MLISLRSIYKSYDKHSYVLEDFNLDIEEGSFVSLLGASGSGKSTILNLISGFIKPDSGKIFLNGVDIKDIPPNQRPTATVFQDYALFPNMNVFDNIAFGLKKMFTDKQVVGQKEHRTIEELHQKAINKSKEKIEGVNKKLKALEIRKKRLEDQLSKLSKGSPAIYWKKILLRNCDLGIVDLDYWKSYWAYYPILTRRKLVNKYTKRPLNKQEIRDRVKNIIELVGLEGKEHHMQHSLSGGQQQRVALARAIVTEPQILLLDEPLSALDEEVREKLQLQLKHIHESLKITFLLITHNQKEALVLSDKIVVLKKGKIEQIGTPTEIYDSPANRWVANFMGKANIFTGIYLRPGVIDVSGSEFTTDVVSGFSQGEQVYVMIRPEDYDVVEISKGFISVVVNEVIYKGQLWELQCLFMDSIIYVEAVNHVTIGSQIGLVWDPADVHVMKYD